MPIRVQPADVKIGKDDPFANDLLERKVSIEALTTLLGNIEGPCVMAVDASWGMGKTTFLRMWAQHLRNQGFPVVDFSAWETDYAGQPFVALTSEINNGLREWSDELDSRHFKRLVESSGRVLTRLSAPAVRLAASAVPLVGDQLVEELDNDPSTLAEKMASDYTSMKEAMSAFRKHLEKAAAEAASLAGGNSIVVLVDELDRCRPTYAIELLETAKHFFSVDHVVFVLCLDREQLAHSIQAVYGAKFDASGYLRRFFDIDYHLLNADRGRLARATLNSIGIVESLAQRPRPTDNDWHSDPTNLSELFGLPNLSLRDSLQLLHRFGVVLASIPSDQVLFSDTLAVLMVLRTIDRGLYGRVLDGTAADIDAVSAIYAHLGKELPFNSSARLAIEGVLAACICLSSRDAQNEPNLAKIPMLKRYHDLATNPSPQQQGYDPETEHAGIVLAYVNRFFNRPYAQGRYELGRVRDDGIFRISVQRLELFPDDLDDVGIRRPPR